MENIQLAVAREVVDDRLHFSFAQNFRRTARTIGVDFGEKEEGDNIVFFAKDRKDVNTLKMIADAS